MEFLDLLTTAPTALIGWPARATQYQKQNSMGLLMNKRVLLSQGQRTMRTVVKLFQASLLAGITPHLDQHRDSTHLKLCPQAHVHTYLKTIFLLRKRHLLSVKTRRCPPRPMAQHLRLQPYMHQGELLRVQKPLQAQEHTCLQALDIAGHLQVQCQKAKGTLLKVCVPLVQLSMILALKTGDQSFQCPKAQKKQTEKRKKTSGIVFIFPSAHTWVQVHLWGVHCGANSL
mmetsp:Transcript_22827/g.37593  ORF Transcript_22827/g.37593 Transcript_22827/m.37593 type:complete len:229 (+) Transcript_22827:234-920(+)